MHQCILKLHVNVFLERKYHELYSSKSYLGINDINSQSHKNRLFLFYGFCLMKDSLLWILDENNRVYTVSVIRNCIDSRSAAAGNVGTAAVAHVTRSGLLGSSTVFNCKGHLLPLDPFSRTTVPASHYWYAHRERAKMTPIF